MLHCVCRELHQRLRHALPVSDDRRLGERVELPVAQAERGGLRQDVVDERPYLERRRLKSGCSHFASVRRSSTIRLIRSSSSITRASVCAVLRVVLEQLEVAADDGPACAARGRVVDEALLGRERRLEAGEHVVERLREDTDLVVPGLRDPP